MHQFGPLVSDVWTDIHRIRHKKRRDEHPCQLPIHLLERLLLMSTDEEDIVLDPFVGTGTTAIAAKKLGRKFIGIDIDTNMLKSRIKN
jgi:site-specific DNA-methyltransferase (adenine-specific)